MSYLLYNPIIMKSQTQFPPLLYLAVTTYKCQGMTLPEIITWFLNELHEKYNARKKQVKRLKEPLKIKSVRKSLTNGPCIEYSLIVENYK